MVKESVKVKPCGERPIDIGMCNYLEYRLKESIHTYIYIYIYIYNKVLKYTFSRCKYETPDIHPHVLICALYDIHGCPSNDYLGVLTHGPMYLCQDICISIYTCTHRYIFTYLIRAKLGQA